MEVDSIHDKVLMEIGLDELDSSSFIVSEGNPVILTLVSTNRISRGPVIKIQKLSEGRFINYGTPEDGYRVLKHNRKRIKIITPGEYRLHRPDLSIWDIPLGVMIRTSKAELAKTTEKEIKLEPSSTPEPSISSTPEITSSPIPTPTPTPTESKPVIKKLLPDDNIYTASVGEPVDITLNDSPSCELNIWYDDLPYNLWIEYGKILGVCRVKGEYEVGIEAKLDDVKDFKLITISVK